MGQDKCRKIWEAADVRIKWKYSHMKWGEYGDHEIRKESVRENLKGEGETGAKRRLSLSLMVVPHDSRPAPR